MNTSVRNQLWIAMLLAGLVLTGMHAMAGERLASFLYYTAAFMALAAAIFAFRLHRPERRAPWYVLIASIATLITADLTWEYYDAIFGQEVPYPSYADILYVAGFGAAIVAFILWNRHSNDANHREDGIDASIVSLGLAVIVWMFVVEPRLGDTDLNLPAQMLSIAYPILDLFLLVMLIRIAMRRGLGSYRSLGLFAIGTIAFGTSDILWGWGELTDTYSAFAVIANSGWMLCYVFWGAAALDPTVLALEKRNPQSMSSGAYLSRRRATLLIGTAMLVPVTLIVQRFQELSLDMLVMAIGAAMLFALVVSRLQLIVRSLESAMERQSELQQGLEFAAFHDPLTGLANRALLNLNLENMVEQHREKAIALLFIDLDNFKDINDRLGHAVGDQLLVEVAKMLHKCIRPQDTIGRIGGDEFVILLKFEGESPLDASIAISERILKMFASPMTIDGAEVQVGASIGIAWLGNNNVSVDSILRAADHAMYDAKRAGKNRYSVAPVVSDLDEPDKQQHRSQPNRALIELRPVGPDGLDPRKLPFSA